MGKCVPGMPCYGDGVIVYTTYPKGCTTTEESPYTLPLSSTNVYYAGANLPYTGVQTEDTLTVALQKIDDIIGTRNLPTVVEFNVFNAELLTVEGTPKELIVPPAIGKYIRIHRITVKQRPLTTDYPISEGGNFNITYGASAVILAIGSLRAGANYGDTLFHRSFDYPTAGSDYFEPTIENKGVYLTNSSTITANGDSYLDIRIEYTIETF